MSVQLLSASAISMSELAHLLTQSYQGYYVPLRMNDEQLHQHVLHYNIDLDLSRIALVDGQPIGLGFLGRRNQHGWIGGLGVVPTHRRQGIARQIMLDLLQQGQTLSLSQIQLEAITLNDPAIALYESLGFMKHRVLHIVEGQPEGEWLAGVVELSPQLALEQYHVLHAVQNPWHRDLSAIERLMGLSSAYAIYEEGQIVAYVMGIFEQHALQFFDMGCLPNKPNLLRRVVSYLHHLYPLAKGGMVNLAENDPAWTVLFVLGYKPILSQHEMLLKPLANP